MAKHSTGIGMDSIPKDLGDRLDAFIASKHPFAPSKAIVVLRTSYVFKFIDWALSREDAEIPPSFPGHIEYVEKMTNSKGNPEDGYDIGEKWLKPHIWYCKECQEDAGIKG